jgi:hypothetical protein
MQLALRLEDDTSIAAQEFLRPPWVWRIRLLWVSFYLSRATTKSGTHSRARLNSESSSEAKASLPCSA